MINSTNMATFFNPVVSLKEKVISSHPWDRNIKDIYSSTYRYAHNSVSNPVYPPKKERKPDVNRVRFTIIGNRVIEDFIYSVNLVKRLHKYRWKWFDSPVIRGVSSVDWPLIWNGLKLQYGGLAYCIKSQLAVLINDKFLGGFSELKEFIESKYVCHLNFDYYKEGVDQFARYIRFIGLYSDIAPLTCENFMRLCKTKKGGYSGTPIHRIVKDCWIQCGGFGLKSTSLECENFIVPHDRRGVLCMANDGRHVDCSTQFFVLLQPAPWMAHKYVAFGQLIDGEETLKKIETVQTWYEAPTTPIIISEAGILNMDCHGITISKETNAYIQRHIEDLVKIGEIFYEALLENVFLEIEFRKVQRLAGIPEEEAVGEEGTKNLRATQRFMLKKEDINQQQQIRSSLDVGYKSENNEFDMEVYEYEPEEHPSPPVTPANPVSSQAKPEKPYYLALTDVPYPGEVDSTYDLKKMLKGDYCLESDLDKNAALKLYGIEPVPSDMFQFDDNDDDDIDVTDEVTDSDEAIDLKRYLKMNADRLSFAGDYIKNIAKHGHARVNLFEGSRMSELINDEELRRFRLASVDYRQHREKKVSISLPSSDKAHAKIKRRQTGFIRPEDLERIRIYKKRDSEISEQEEEEDDDDDDKDYERARKVRMASSTLLAPKEPKTLRRPTAYVGPAEAPDSGSDANRPSVLTRLYDEVKCDDAVGPTLKDYKPTAETQLKNLMFLKSAPKLQFKNTEKDRGEYTHQSLIMDENPSLDQVLNIQHGSKLSGQISSDYVKTIDQIEQKPENSLRSVEFAKRRPTISVSEYQMKVQKHQNKLNSASKTQGEIAKTNKVPTGPGLRLPGDTPIYSFTSLSISY